MKVAPAWRGQEVNVLTFQPWIIWFIVMARSYSKTDFCCVTNRQTQQCGNVGKTLAIRPSESSAWTGINVLKCHPMHLVVMSECECTGGSLFFFFFLFTGPVPSPPEGEDAIVARISGKFRETPRLKKQSLLLLFYNSQQGVDIKEKERQAGYFLQFTFFLKKKGLSWRRYQIQTMQFLSPCVFSALISRPSHGKQHR